jgi:hypothetical protein
METKAIAVAIAVKHTFSPSVPLAVRMCAMCHPARKMICIASANTNVQSSSYWK